jgi:hypothetical protein
LLISATYVRSRTETQEESLYTIYNSRRHSSLVRRDEHHSGPLHLPHLYKGNIMKYSLLLVAVAAFGLSACQKQTETPPAPPATVIQVPVTVPGPAGEPGKPGAEGMPGATGATGNAGATGGAGATGTAGTPGEPGKPGDTIIVVPESK